MAASDRIAGKADRSAPTPAEAVALLAARRAPEHLVRHSMVVAGVACHLADALIARGLPLDRAVVRAAGLLHDLAKGAPGHAAAGERVLRRLGFPAVAAAIGQHHDIQRAAGAPPDEAALVYLADKLVRGDRLVGLEERLRSTLAAHGSSAEARAAIERRHGDALAIARAVEALTGTDLASLLGGADAPGLRVWP
jgi:hypothetical protein